MNSFYASSLSQFRSKIVSTCHEANQVRLMSGCPYTQTLNGHSRSLLSGNPVFLIISSCPITDFGHDENKKALY
jgi:hypothetical protein